MGMTITEKILSRAAGKDKVNPGDLVNARIDVVMCHDVTTPPAISMLKAHGIDRVFDPAKIVVTPDHFQPAKDIKSAGLHKRLDTWAREKGIKHYYKLGKAGVCHALLPEQGHIRPGQVIVGVDSHTCTYGALAAFSTGIGSTDLAAAIATGLLWFKVPASIKFVLKGNLPHGVYSKDVILAVITKIGVDGALYKAMEFQGTALDGMSMEARMTITNMAIEAGAKSGIIGFDRTTKEYLYEHLTGDGDYTIFESDADAEYTETIEIDCSALEPMIALPHLPGNGKAVIECADIGHTGERKRVYADLAQAHPSRSPQEGLGNRPRSQRLPSATSAPPRAELAFRQAGGEEDETMQTVWETGRRCRVARGLLLMV